MKLYHDELAPRDKFMAENIIAMVHKLPVDEKIVIWAHNAHIAVDERWQNMGYWLREAFGDLYYPTALTFSRGGFQSRLMLSREGNNYEMGDLMEFKVGEPRENFWENDLKTFSDNDFFLDFRPLRNLPSFRSWGLEQEKQIFGAGGGFIPFDDKPEETELFDKVVLGKYFDGVFHIQNTTRARPTPTGNRSKGQKSK
jgi:erythromycin esterase